MIRVNETTLDFDAAAGTKQRPGRGVSRFQCLHVGVPNAWNAKMLRHPRAHQRFRNTGKTRMLVQLVYSSLATEPMPKSKLYKILVQARGNNKRADVTGLLVFVDGKFLQVLEGEADLVSQVLRKIAVDTRHKDMKVISEKSIQQRTFASWQMAYASPSARELAAWAGLRDTTTIDGTLASLEQDPNRVSDILTKLLGAISDDALGADTQSS
jgi:hypothetical protein